MNDTFIEMIKNEIKNTPAIILVVTEFSGRVMVDAESHDGSFGFGSGVYESLEGFLNHLILLINSVDNLSYQMIGKPEDIIKDEGLQFRITRTLCAV